ncbi:MAG: hypothetical protein JWO03_3043 [Bacteroidetes bacterium]|nr:hypothetical protein [Bacteroidota bacterium]
MKKTSTKLAILFSAILVLAVGTAFAIPSSTPVAEKYYIAAGEFPNSLATNVNLKMAEGYTPEGGIYSWTNTDHKTYYLQGMVKK